MGSVGAKKSSSFPDAFSGQLSTDSNWENNELYAQDRFNEMTVFNRKLVNPNYLDSVNGKSKGYDNNCALCVAAFALNMRGYNVEAAARDKKWRGIDSIFEPDYTNPDNYFVSGSRYSMASIPSKSGLRNVYGVKGEIPTAARGAAAVAKQIEDKVKSWGNNSYGALNVKWKGYNSGHTVIVANVNGRVQMFDPQSGMTLKSEGFKAYMGKTVANHTSMVRLDNAPIKQGVTKETLNKMFKNK